MLLTALILLPFVIIALGWLFEMIDTLAAPVRSAVRAVFPRAWRSVLVIVIIVVLIASPVYAGTITGRVLHWVFIAAVAAFVVDLVVAENLSDRRWRRQWDADQPAREAAADTNPKPHITGKSPGRTVNRTEDS